MNAFFLPYAASSIKIAAMFEDPWDMPKVSGVYCILNVKNGMRYIGSSHNVRGRCMGHRRKLASGCHCNSFLQQAWRDCGAMAFRFVLIEEVADLAVIAAAEARHIRVFQCAHGERGYNLVVDPTTGSLALAVREKMSRARRGRPAWNRGVPCPEHVKEENRKFHTGKKRPKETCDKVRAAMMGPSHPHRGKQLSKAHRMKLAESFHAVGPLCGRFKGVNLDARTKTFMARIYADGKQIFLGRYETEVEAAHAYNLAAIKYFGRGCFINALEHEPKLKRRTTRGRPVREASHAM